MAVDELNWTEKVCGLDLGRIDAIIEYLFKASGYTGLFTGHFNNKDYSAFTDVILLRDHYVWSSHIR